ncbi:MAG: oligosaccharide flippase family protein [Oscillospiraceae bacterium]|nr:oligosaccharide flippase family protein [Oscillospiraceae bacterium]
MRKLLARYREASPAVRASIWATVCNFLQRGAAVLVVPIFTRLLTTEQYGVCNVYYAWFDIFVLLTSLKLPYEGLNNGLIRHEQDKDGYTSSVLGLMVVLTCVSAVVYWPLRDVIGGFTGISPFLMVFMFIQLLFSPILNLWIGRQRFDFKYRAPVIVTLISTVLSPAIAIVAVLNTSYMAEARIIALAAVQAVFGLGCAVVLLWRGRVFYKKEYWKFAVRFNLPLLAYYLSQTVLNQSDRIMIDHFCGSGKAAIYSVAYTAATLMLLAVSAINGAFSPWLYRKLKAGDHAAVQPVAGQLCLLVAGATLAMTVFAPDVVAILATESYQEAIWIIPPVSASVFFVFLYMQLANVEMFYGKTKGISVVSIVCTLVNVGLNAWAIPRFGFLAAGWTTLVSYVLLAVLHYVLMKRCCPEKVFPVKTILVVCVLELALSFGIMALYPLGWIRYGVIALEAVLVLCFRKRLMGLLDNVRS